MSELATEEAKIRVAEKIGAIEKKTAAEIVVTMRKRSGDYRAADLTVGAIVAAAFLCVFLYHPEEFDFTYFPVEQAIAFAVGAFLCANVPPLRRFFVSTATRHENVARAARALFVDRGVSKTRARTGVLVYLSAFERDAEVVLDVGIDPEKLGAGYGSACAALRAASTRGRLDELLSALDALGEVLAAAHPVTEDDVDELSNEVAA